MVTASVASRDIAQAADGIAAIAQGARDERDATVLAYVAVYACGFAGKGAGLGRYRALAGCLRDDAFVTQLVREVPDTVEVTGWKVSGQEGPRVLIAKDGMRAFVTCEELASVPVPGGLVSFRVPAIRPGQMPGFVLRHGLASLQERSNLSRLYLNIKPAVAAWALGPLARRLDAAGLAFDMKVMANPRAYLRRDSCVVYIHTEDEEEAIRLVARAMDEVRPGGLSRNAPRLTGRMAPGVNLAHEPSDLSEEGISHGQWVAGLFQDAARETSDPRAIAKRVRAAIEKAGRDPSRPHLRPAR